MFRLLKTLSLVFILLPLCIHAQEKQGYLKGIVVDSSKKALSYSTVSLYKPNQFTEALKRTYTTNKGSFDILADTGKYSLTISHVGYPELRLNVSIKPGDNIIDTIVLTSG